MFRTLEALTKDVINELGLVPGVSVQVYKEPIIVAKIQDCFDFLFDKRFWQHLTVTTTHTLDGSTGVVINDLAGVEKFTDIEWIKFYPYFNSHKFKKGIDGEDYQSLDYRFIELPYSDPQFVTKVFKIIPADLEYEIKVRARRKPDPFITGSVVPFDRLVMKHFVAAEILNADGLNPGAADRQQALFDQRYQDLITLDSNHMLEYGVMNNDSFTVADT